MSTNSHRRFVVAIATLTSLLLSLACGSSSSDQVTEQNYSARSARFGSECDPFVAAPQATLRVGTEVCLELMLEGYYTEGTLSAELHHGEQRIARSRIAFNGAQAVLQRITEGEAASRVTFTFHGELPASDYHVVVRRNGREVADYPFRVIE